ncbi:MAG: hypothetical protein ACRDE5_18445 [Ginsengibacter sp.]
MENENTLSAVTDSQNQIKIPVKPLVDKNELKDFYTQGLPKIIRNIFFAPVEGTYSLFTNRSDKTYFHSLILIASTAVLYMIIPYLILPSEMRELLGFSFTIKMGIAACICMLLVSAVSFLVKMVSGKADFKNELLTGGLCGIPLTLMLFLFLIAKFFINEDSISDIAFDPTSVIAKGGIFFLFVFYIFLMMINILMQSLRSGGTKDALRWYISPLGILIAFYLTFKITASFF